MAATVASMLTTTPFFSPREGCEPMPRTSSEPSGPSSPTRHATFEVPMSSATTRFLFSFGISRAADALAIRIQQTFAAPARERDMLFDRHLEAIGPDAAHGGPAHPRQALERSAQLIDGCGEEIRARMTCHDSVDFGTRRVGEAG